MIHVVDFEKTAFSTPFRGVLPPFGQQISAESGRATQSLAPGKPGWPPTSTWPLFSRPTPHQRGQVVRGPSPAGYCLLPTAELAKTERGPISMSTPSISVCHRIRRFVRIKSTDSSPLAAAQPLNILSWPETLNASGSRRACRMAVRRNACSLLALPDFPEFPQAVRYGVLASGKLWKGGRDSNSETFR